MWMKLLLSCSPPPPHNSFPFCLILGHLGSTFHCCLSSGHMHEGQGSPPSILLVHPHLPTQHPSFQKKPLVFSVPMWEAHISGSGQWEGKESFCQV